MDMRDAYKVYESDDTEPGTACPIVTPGWPSVLSIILTNSMPVADVMGPMRMPDGSRYRVDVKPW